MAEIWFTTCKAVAEESGPRGGEEEGGVGDMVRQVFRTVDGSGCARCSLSLQVWPYPKEAVA